jgi:hypothetical protein
MAYNNFTLETVKSQFNLTIINGRFCDSLPIVEPQPEFTIVFSDLFELAEGARTEKAKSELLVTPILAQATKLSGGRVKLFSGEEFNVDQERGLNGFCDFLFSRSANPYTLDERELDSPSSSDRGGKATRAAKDAPSESQDFQCLS